MVKVILLDFSRVLLFPLDDKYSDSLNSLHKLHLNDKDYSVFNLFKLNLDLLNYFETKMHFFRICMLTSETIQEAPEFSNYLNPIFNKIYGALQIGLKKNDPEIYEYIYKDLQLEPNEILYIDDSLENVCAAKQAGLQTVHYQNNAQLMGEVDKILAV